MLCENFKNEKAGRSHGVAAHISNQEKKMRKKKDQSGRHDPSKKKKNWAALAHPN